MNKYYITLSSSQNGSKCGGYIEVIANTEQEARSLVCGVLGDKWSTSYAAFENMHPADAKNKLATLHLEGQIPVLLSYLLAPEVLSKVPDNATIAYTLAEFEQDPFSKDKKVPFKVIRTRSVIEPKPLIKPLQTPITIVIDVHIRIWEQTKYGYTYCSAQVYVNDTFDCIYIPMSMATEEGITNTALREVNRKYGSEIPVDVIYPLDLAVSSKATLLRNGIIVVKHVKKDIKRNVCAFGKP